MRGFDGLSHTYIVGEVYKHWTMLDKPNLVNDCFFTPIHPYALSEGRGRYLLKREGGKRIENE